MMRRYAGAEPVTAVTPPADYYLTVVTGARRSFEMGEMGGGVNSVVGVGVRSWGDRGRLREIAAVTL